MIKDGSEDMLYKERTDVILQQLQLKGSIKVADLVRILGVSPDTVRRDLKSLEENGQLKYMHGGACLPDTSLAFSSFSGREIINIDEKRVVAIKAMEYIVPGSVIVLNSGTTNVIVAQEIIKRFSDLTVITNNISAAMVLMQNKGIRTIVLGGTLNAFEHSTYGSVCEREMEKYHPDLCFLSINSIDYMAGYTDFRYEEMGIMQIMAEKSKLVVAVMDHSKLGRKSNKEALEKASIDILLMDRASEDEKKLYKQYGIKIE